MTKSLFSPVVGLIQDILLLSAVFLFVLAVIMVISLRLQDYLTTKKRRKAMMGRVGLAVIV